MQFYLPGSAYYGEFTTSNPETHAATDANSTPTATATKNGVDDAAFVLTVARIATGRYKITGTVPSGYIESDRIQISVAATVSGIAGNSIVDAFQVVSGFATHADITALGTPMQAGTSVVLAASQSNYAPAKAGDKMDLLETAITALTDADIFTGAFSDTVLVNAPRTEMVLSAASFARGPEASLGNEDIPATVFRSGSPRLTARVYLDGADITKAAVSTITYTIYELGRSVNDRTAVTGHTNVSLNANNILFDTLQSDAQASKYNFCHQVPVSTNPAFTIAGRVYLVEYKIQPVTGEIVIVRFRVDTI